MWVRGLGHQGLGLGSQVLVNITVLRISNRTRQTDAHSRRLVKRAQKKRLKLGLVESLLALDQQLLSGLGAVTADAISGLRGARVAATCTRLG